MQLQLQSIQQTLSSHMITIADVLAGTVTFTSLDARAGIDLPGEAGQPMLNLANAFALEGLGGNESSARSFRPAM